MIRIEGETGRKGTLYTDENIEGIVEGIVDDDTCAYLMMTLDFENNV